MAGEKGISILIVDDEAPIRSLMSYVLRSEGFTVFATANPTEAWKIWCRERDRIQLLICDVNLPMMNGPELAREFVLMKPGLRVLFVTGSSQLAIETTMDLMPLIKHRKFLEKPFTATSLKSEVIEALGQQ